MIKQVADTNICIYFLDGRPSAVKWWGANIQATAITDVVKLELLAGGKTADERQKIDKFLQQLPIIQTRREDLVEVEKCYRQWDFQKHPSATKLADAVIAKVTIAAGLSLATLDLKHFQKMDELSVFAPFTI